MNGGVPMWTGTFAARRRNMKALRQRGVRQQPQVGI